MATTDINPLVQNCLLDVCDEQHERCGADCHCGESDGRASCAVAGARALSSTSSTTLIAVNSSASTTVHAGPCGATLLTVGLIDKTANETLCYNAAQFGSPTYQPLDLSTVVQSVNTVR